MNPITPYLSAIKWGAGLLLVGLLIGAGWWGGSRSGAAEVAALRLTQAERDAKAAQALTKATTAARDIEHEMGDRFVAASLAHQQELRRAKADRDALAAAVRSGAVQLRDHWTGCLSAAAQAAAGAGRSDAAADLRAAGAGDLVQVARNCDAQARGLQAVLNAERK